MASIICWPIHEAPNEILQKLFEKEKTYIELKDGNYKIKYETPTHSLLKKRFINRIKHKIASR